MFICLSLFRTSTTNEQKLHLTGVIFHVIAKCCS